MGMVERLAERWHKEICCEGPGGVPDSDDRMVAAFFMNAIADELDKDARAFGLTTEAGDWLRSQIKEM